jgi:hypothetical protein
MFRRIGIVFASLLFCLLLALPVLADEGQNPAETQKKTDQPEIVEGMKQGDFAMTLIKTLGAQNQLPTAATTKDAFNFLEKIGCVPEKGWDQEASITKEDLCYILSLKSDECEAGTFEDLLEKLKKKLADILWELGIKTVAPLTISPTI